MTTVLVIGGYGTFGRRLVRMLSEIEGLSVLVGGRDPGKAEAVIAALGGPANLTAQRIDRHQPLAAQLGTQPDIVVDAVGPFQSYAKTRDPVFDYCMSVGATYIDLSDDPEFCAHMVERAEAASITVATGWSTFSALTGAAVHAIGGEGPTTAGIVPNPRQPMGRAVIDSVLSYAGRRLRSGAKGLTRTRRETVRPPGVLPMRNLLFSNVATPDAVLLHPEATGWTAPQPELLHRLLILMARLSGWRLLPRLTLFGGLIHGTQAFIRVGEPRGGLFVETPHGRFDLIGDGDAAPDVPVIPAAALIAAIHAGDAFTPGLLRPGAAFPLDRMAPWLDRAGIAYGVREPGGNLYTRTLGGAMAELPEPIRDLHAGGQFTGRATVTRGRNPLSRLIANLFGLPKAGEHDVLVSITTDAHGVERWSRTYSGHEMLSFQSEGSGRTDGLILERFGPITVHLGFAVEGEGERLRYRTRGWTLFGLHLPRKLAPGGEIYERVDDQGRFRFHVDIIAPGFGRLVKYEGWLERS